MLEDVGVGWWVSELVREHLTFKKKNKLIADAIDGSGARSGGIVYVGGRCQAAASEDMTVDTIVCV
jgi:hypothetical protein